MPTVSAVLVNWNGLNLLPAALASLGAQTTPVAEIIVVDNGSSDGSLAWLEGRSDVVLIRNQENLGFAAANNQAIDVASGDLVLLMNTDVELAPDYIELCSAAFGSADIGSVTGKLLRPGPARIVDSTGHSVYGLGWAENRGEMQPDHGIGMAGEVFGVCAAAALYRRTALDEAAVDGEFLDESYFSYIEDVDLDWRLRWAGWRAWYEPAAEAIHHRSATGARFTAPVTRHILKNRILTVIKNYDRASLFWNLPGLVAFTTVKAADFGRQHPTAVMGLVDAARLSPRAIRWRRQVRPGRRPGAGRPTSWLRPFPWMDRLARRFRRFG